MFPSKTKNSLLRHFLILLMVFLFIGCGAQVSLTKKDRLSIQSVSINKDIPKPDDIYYHGSKEVMLWAAIGIPGVIAGTQTIKGPKSMLKYVMERDNIDVAQIVREEFTNELKKSNLFNSIVHEKGEAEFRLSIHDYGFSVPHGLTSKLRPALIVRGSLVKPDGSILWKKQGGVFAKGGTPSYTLEEYLKNSELIREAFTIASQIVAKGFIDDMIKE